MEKVFISGSANCNKLDNMVTSTIDVMISKNYTILIGDCNGVDSMVQSYLNEKDYNNVIVYCSGSKCRNLANSDWQVNHISVPAGTKGRAFYEVKDIAMSNDADYGFAVWDGKSVGTWNNVCRMANDNKYVKVFRNDLNKFETYNENIFKNTPERNDNYTYDV